MRQHRRHHLEVRADRCVFLLVGHTAPLPDSTRSDAPRIKRLGLSASARLPSPGVAATRCSASDWRPLDKGSRLVLDGETRRDLVGELLQLLVVFFRIDVSLAEHQEYLVELEQVVRP